MIIQIKTISLPYENGFALYRTEYLDGEKQQTYKGFEATESKLQADLLNVGLALKHLIEFNKNFGIGIKSEFRKRTTDKDFKQVFTEGKESFLCYTESKEKVFESVLTENIELFENLKYSNRFYDKKIIRLMLARITQLSKENLITVTLTKEVMESWQKDGALKYG